MGPSIERTDSFDGHAMRWTLVVPLCWLIRTRYPRLALLWWLCRLAWRARDEGHAAYDRGRP
jgi:hypothetical protein